VVKMNRIFAEAIAACNDNVSVYQNYSGRGMFGKTTTGLVGQRPIDAINDILLNSTFSDEDRQDFFERIKNAFDEVSEEDSTSLDLEDWEICVDEDGKITIERFPDMEGFRHDSMGRDEIVY